MRVDNLTRFRAEQLFEVLLDGEQIEEISAGLKIDEQIQVACSYSG